MKISKQVSDGKWDRLHARNSTALRMEIEKCNEVLVSPPTYGHVHEKHYPISSVLVYLVSPVIESLNSICGRLQHMRTGAISGLSQVHVGCISVLLTSWAARRERG